jgi:hypothetical protein
VLIIRILLIITVHGYHLWLVITSLTLEVKMVKRLTIMLIVISFSWTFLRFQYHFNWEGRRESNPVYVSWKIFQQLKPDLGFGKWKILEHIKLRQPWYYQSMFTKAFRWMRRFSIIAIWSTWRQQYELREAPRIISFSRCTSVRAFIDLFRAAIVNLLSYGSYIIIFGSTLYQFRSHLLAFF